MASSAAGLPASSEHGGIYSSAASGLMFAPANPSLQAVAPLGILRGGAAVGGGEQQPHGGGPGADKIRLMSPGRGQSTSRMLNLVTDRPTVQSTGRSRPVDRPTKKLEVTSHMSKNYSLVACQKLITSSTIHNCWTV